MKLNTREYRRKRAIGLLKTGWKQKQIAEALDVSQGAVSQWKKRYELEGSACWKDKFIPGAPAKLSAEDEQALKKLILNGAVAWGFEGEFWTHKRVSRLILEQFQKELSPKQCGRILKKLELTRQKPQLHSKSQKPEEVKQWKEERLPALKKS